MSAVMSRALDYASGSLRAVYEKRPRLDAGDFLNLALLITVLSLALTVRLLNFRYDGYGLYLSEFDPYWHYRCADYIAKNGIEAFLLWNDNMSWVPGGRPVAVSTPIGLPLFAAFVQYLFKMVGVAVDMLTITIFLPPVSGIFAALSVYFLAKELVSREAGIVSAVLIAFNGSHIERTHLGFFKHETLGIPLIVMVGLFYLKAIKSKDEKGVWLYSILSGLSLGYLGITWTGYVYATGLVSLLTVVLTLLSLVDTSRMLLVFSVVQGLFMGLASIFPRSQGEMLSLYLALALAAFASIILKREMDRMQSLKAKISFLAGAFAIVGLLALVAMQLGLLSGLYGKLAAILNPALRSEDAIIESVSEHKVSSWFTLFNDHGPLLLLFGFSLVTSITSLTVDNVFLLLTGATSLYFSTMMVRLGLILSPFSTSFGAVGAQRLLYGLFPEAPGPMQLEGRKVRRRGEAVGFSTLALSGILVAGLLAPAVITGMGHAGAPVTIVGATLPYAVEWPDWLETVAWIRENTPKGSVIMSWWDYGYWITTLGDRPTVIDNATINTTQVALVGRAFISNDTVALPIMRRLNVSYVVVFTTLPYNTQLGFWGDEVKWIWMAEIGYQLKTEPNHTQPLTMFGDPEFSQYLANNSLLATTTSSSGVKYPNILLPNRDFVLTKLMTLASFGAITGYVGEDPHFTLVFKSTTIQGYPGMVSVWKVNYEYERLTYISLTATSNDTDTTSWKWIDDYGVYAGSRVTFTVPGVNLKAGSYVANGTSFNLGSAAFVELLDDIGKAVFSMTPIIGSSTLIIYQDRVAVIGPNGQTEEYPANFSGRLRLSFRVSADMLPAGVNATAYDAATVDLSVSSIKIGLASLPG